MGSEVAIGGSKTPRSHRGITSRRPERQTNNLLDRDITLYGFQVISLSLGAPRGYTSVQRGYISVQRGYTSVQARIIFVSEKKSPIIAVSTALR